MDGKSMLFIVSAPSGAGKTTLVTAALEFLSKMYPIERVVTYTTRTPRLGDVPGIDYHFITEQEFIAQIEMNNFLEWSTAYGHYYGTPRSIIDGIRNGRSFVAVIDRQGAREIMKHIPDAITIWLQVPSLQELRARIIKRGANSEEQIERRLMLARQEIEEEAVTKKYQHHIMNDNFTQALQCMVLVIENCLKSHPSIERNREQVIR